MTAEQLGALLDELGKRLGPTGSHVFDLAVRQALIEGVVSTIGFVLGLVALVSTRRVYRWYLAGAEEGSRYNDREMAAVFGCTGLGLGALCGIVQFLFWGVLLLLNPEYAAIQSILSSLPK